MATTTVGSSTVVFSNSTAAANISDSAHTEDNAVFTIDALAVSGGGAKATLYSVDDGIKNDDGGAGITVTNKAFVDYNKDLLLKDAALSDVQAVMLAETSAKGAKFWIGTDGKLHYDASSLGLNAMAAGEVFTDTIQYTIRLANGTLSVGTIAINIAGTNDGPDITIGAGDSAAAAVSETNAGLTAGGSLTVTDADLSDTVSLAVTAVATGGTYAGPLPDVSGFLTVTGSVAANAGDAGNAAWSFNSGNEAFDFLQAGETVVLTYTITATDVQAVGPQVGATDAQTVTITITGTNDVAAISGMASGSGDEDATALITGTLTVIDADHDQSHSQAAGGTSAKGDWSVDADGNWSYVVNNAANQHLAAGASTTDSFTVVSADGTASQLVEVTINGANDVASITGNAAGSASEDAAAPISGSLVVSDVDDGEAHAQAAGGTSAKGDWSVDADGNWSYVVNNAANQHLAAGASTTDSFTVVSADGTASQLVTVTINGANDAASITGTDTGATTEDGTASAGGKLDVSDADHGQSAFIASSSDTPYGFFDIDENGNWTYTLDNDAAQGLGSTDHPTETFTVHSVDGTAHDIVVTINGADEAVVGPAPSPAVHTGGGDPQDNDNAPNGTASGSPTPGNDTLQASLQNQVNIVDLLGGNDVYYGRGNNDSITGNTGNDSLYGQQGNDTLVGSDGADRLYGGSGNDSLAGDLGDDVFFGGSGSDTINGSGGADTLVGGYGADSLTGDTGVDVFRYASVNDTGDVIADFQAGVGGDLLDLAALGVVGHSIFQVGFDTLVQVSTDLDASTAEFEVTLLGVTASNLVGSNFQLI